MKYFIFYRLNNLTYFNNKLISDTEIETAKNIFQYFDEIISIKEKLKDENKDLNSDNIDKEKEKNNNSNDMIVNEEKGNNFDDINTYEEKIEFFKYAKYNLSVAIEDIIKDEENNDDD